jgi:hypothetical protein
MKYCVRKEKERREGERKKQVKRGKQRKTGNLHSTITVLFTFAFPARDSDSSCKWYALL